MPSACEQRERVRTLFNDRARDWAAGYASLRDYRQHSLQRRRHHVLELLTAAIEPGRILDVGCGTGDYAEPLIGGGHEVWCVDASSDMIATVQARFASQKPVRVHAAIGDVERLPYPSEFFDGVVCAGVLEYVPDVRTALRELARVLRTGGVAVVTVPNIWSIFTLGDVAMAHLVRSAGWALDACGLFERLMGRPRATHQVPHRQYRPSRFARQAASVGLALESWRFCSFGSFALNRAVPGAVAFSAWWERFGEHPVLGRLGVTTVMRFRKGA